MKNALFVGLVLVLIGVIVVTGPLITIWVLNTLFSLGIAYTGWTWLARLLFTLTFAPKSLIKAKIQT